MLFKDLKINYPVYALRKDNDVMKAIQGKVVSVSAPHVENIRPGQMSTSQLVVDVTIDLDGERNTYSIPEMLSVTYAGNSLVLSVDRDGILREIEAMKAQSEEALRSVDKHKKILDDCTSILSDWNPAFKDKKEADERFNKIEESVSNLTEMFSKFMNEFKNK